jgi:hypothetical protein
MTLTIPYKAQMDTESIHASVAVITGPVAKRSVSLALSLVSLDPCEHCSLLILFEGAMTGAGRCYYKYQAGTYFASNQVINSQTGAYTLYAGAYLLSNGTSSKPVRLSSDAAAFKLLIRIFAVSLLRWCHLYRLEQHCISSHVRLWC